MQPDAGGSSLEGRQDLQQLMAESAGIVPIQFYIQTQLTSVVTSRLFEGQDVVRPDAQAATEFVITEAAGDHQNLIRRQQVSIGLIGLTEQGRLDTAAAVIQDHSTHPPSLGLAMGGGDHQSDHHHGHPAPALLAAVART